MPLEVDSILELVNVTATISANITGLTDTTLPPYLILNGNVTIYKEVPDKASWYKDSMVIIGIGLAVIFLFNGLLEFVSRKDRIKDRVKGMKWKKLVPERFTRRRANDAGNMRQNNTPQVVIDVAAPPPAYGSRVAHPPPPPAYGNRVTPPPPPPAYSRVVYPTEANPWARVQREQREQHEQRE